MPPLALQEAMPNAMLEAMASGLPCITTNTGASELVHDSGIVVEVGNAAQIRDGLMTYLRDPQLLQLHGKNGRSRAEALTWAKKTEAYLEVYARILGRPL